MIHKGHEECLNQFKRLREQRLASVTMGSGHFVTDTKYPDPIVIQYGRSLFRWSYYERRGFGTLEIRKAKSSVVYFEWRDARPTSSFHKSKESVIMEANKTVLQMKYARIVNLFAKESGMSLEDALSFFYNSTTYELISEGVADLHCRSDEYLADELMLEYKEKGNS